MNLVIRAFFLLLIGILSTGPVWAQQDGTYGQDVKERKMVLPKCDTPVGAVVAKGFICKAAACHRDSLVFSGYQTIYLSPQRLGEGMADMLLTALVETGCFEVFERAALEDVKEEMRLHGKQPKDLLEGADYVITGSITALEMNAAGKGGGGGGFVVPLPFIGGVGVKGGKSEAHIGLDLRAIRVKDARIVVSKAVEGKSGRWNFGIGGFGWFGAGGAGGWFNSFKNTPLEEATRDVIAGAVTLLVENMAKKNITGTLSPK
jgi:curli biogenesis system outer membrane secretion channel CsgG